ncbi:MAG: hypothetical protein LQ342_003695 [Letrouitia transgressa]|nr:MAG: hypothetical protein LQ342_003695 [Letrouitia transgressa]
MVQCGFNTLIPALVFQLTESPLKLRIFAQYQIGPLDTGGPLANGFTGGNFSNGNGIGTLTSLPTYTDIPSPINATSIHMDDFNSVAGGPYTLDARGLVKNHDGAIFGVKSLGLLANTPHVQDILANKSGVAPTRWGEIETATIWSFQAGGKYRDLTESTFVANIRVSPPDNEDTVSLIEYRLSKVLPGELCDGGV